MTPKQLHILELRLSESMHTVKTDVTQEYAARKKWRNGKLVLLAFMLFVGALALVCYGAHEKFTFWLLTARVAEGFGDLFLDRGWE